MQWTIFPALAAAVADRHRDRVGAVAGITAYQAVAAQRNIPLGMPGIALVVADDADTIQHRMATADTVVLYKGRADGAPLKAACAAHGRSLAVVETSAPGIPANTSASGNIAEVANGPLSYLTTAIASAPVSARVSG